MPRWLAAALFAFAAFDATAELQLRIAETSPALPAVLTADEPIFLRIEFSGAEKSNLWARPYYRGEPVMQAKTNTSLQHVGSGSALAWFSLDRESQVDEVRIRTGGGSPYRETDVLRFPLEVRGTGQHGEQRPRAQWVTDLTRENEIIRRELRSEERSRNSPLDMVIFSGFGLLVMGFLAVNVVGPLWAMWKWRGALRVIGILPLPVMAFVVGRIIVDTSHDPTSHNLWPFEILMVGGGGVALYFLLGVIRRVRGGSA
ncbi:hypothetical protein BWI17_02210 [Betaproteobacteria bacterium GR16-43]|nr:hypothetical protein BWI17_02210 [Betaproteobacteria bacterium GR16-43]